MARTFVLYVGDAPTRLDVAVHTRSAKAAAVDHVAVTVGRKQVIAVRPIGDEAPHSAFAIEALSPGVSGLLVETRAASGRLLGRVEAFIDVRPADGHTILLDVGRPDAALATPTPPRPAGELSVATARELSEKNQAGTDQPNVGTSGATPENKATVLRAKLIERLNLAPDASDEDVHRAIDGGMENAFRQGHAEASDAAAKKNSEQVAG